jgi:hypothetical protein
MLTGTIPFNSFWSSPWSAPLRGACHWLKREPAPVVPATPDALAPGWLRPLSLQRQIGQAIGWRLKWMREHPDHATFLFPTDSIPVWHDFGWQPYGRGVLRTWSDEWLNLHFVMEFERLLRIIQTPPRLMGEETWTRAALDACQHLAQVYHEFRRRYSSRRVRWFVRRVLEEYISWEPAPESEAAAEAALLTPSDRAAPPDQHRSLTAL